MANGLPDPDCFVELRPFYGVCRLGLIGAASAGALLSGNVVVQSKPELAPVLMLAYGALVFALYRILAAKDRARRETRVLEARRSERQRLTLRLDPFRRRLRELTGNETADLLVVGGRRVNAWTERSRAEPLVLLTAAFWGSYYGRPELDGALAHEAGHIRAGDVETFHQLFVMLRAVLFALLVAALLVLAAFAVAGRAVAAQSGALLFGSFLACVLAIGGGWSALLVARELQADAYASRVLADHAPIREFLARQRSGRDADRSAGIAARFWTWLVQPSLSARGCLLAASGRLAPRVEILLGVAALGTSAVWAWNALLVSDLSPLLTMFAAALKVVVALWTCWLSYAFLWGRSASLGGRSATAFGQAGLSWLGFVGPSLLATGIWLFVGRLMIDLRPEQAEFVMLALPLLAYLSFLLFAVSKLAVSWDLRQGASRARVWTLLALVVVLAVSIFATQLVLGIALRPVVPNEEVRSSMCFAFGLLGVPLVFALLGHRLTPRRTGNG